MLRRSERLLGGSNPLSGRARPTQPSPMIGPTRRADGLISRSERRSKFRTANSNGINRIPLVTASSSCRNGHVFCYVQPGVHDGLIQPVGTTGQALGRGFVPRLSAGTLQLSIRCSSIHFLPRRSFPVSVAGKVAAFGASWRSGNPSWASAGGIPQIAKKRPSALMYNVRIGDLAILGPQGKTSASD